MGGVLGALGEVRSCLQGWYGMNCIRWRCFGRFVEQWKGEIFRHGMVLRDAHMHVSITFTEEKVALAETEELQ